MIHSSLTCYDSLAILLIPVISMRILKLTEEAIKNDETYLNSFSNLSPTPLNASLNYGKT
ncbi:MAG: hypothetical protein B6U94_06675 [Thermofilum sp. ex4484_79]|nr:MAG: hypothetical protein B6U94_06675 [Thermofilum sp. ex4484_79]